MYNRKNQKNTTLLTIILICSILGFSVGFNLQLLTGTVKSEDNFDILLPKMAATFVNIEIDALATTNTTNSGNWTWAKDIGICTGLGTPSSPYLIQDHIFDNGAMFDDCLRILNSREYFVIRTCTFRNSDSLEAGLYLNNITNGDVINCNAYNCLRGIELSFVNDTELSGNHMYQNNEGLRLSNSHHNIISNNNASDNSNHGIFLTQSTFNTISNNLANQNENINGISLNSNSDDNNVIGNTASFNGQNGIMTDACDEVLIQNNIIFSNVLHGILLDGGNFLYCLQNTVYENSDNGIFLNSPDDCEIENNNIHHNGLDGIRLYASQRNILGTNTIQYNNLSGIHLDFNSHNNLLINNLANNNKEHGILLDSSNNAGLIGNTANNNEMNGIHLLDSNSNSIVSNTANNNRNGTYLENSDINIIVNNILLGNLVCYNETGGSSGNIFENNICTAGVPEIDTVTLSIVLLVFVILEGAALGGIVGIYFLKKRKSKT
ncbi:MAG: right-handed parallel beta-helix repeat-containing protein [Candidatus Hermodarchaeota archaeon]